MCSDMSCISASFRCDNEMDCSDASDEQFCLNTNIPECPEGEFRCGGGGGSSVNHGAAPGSRCILNRFRCDGKHVELCVSIITNMFISSRISICFFFSGENDCDGKNARLLKFHL